MRTLLLCLVSYSRLRDVLPATLKRESLSQSCECNLLGLLGWTCSPARLMPDAEADARRTTDGRHGVEHQVPRGRHGVSATRAAVAQRRGKQIHYCGRMVHLESSINAEALPLCRCCCCSCIYSNIFGNDVGKLKFGIVGVFRTTGVGILPPPSPPSQPPSSSNYNHKQQQLHGNNSNNHHSQK